MATPGKPVPEGFHTVTPHLVVDGAEKALAFYRKAFGAEESYRMPGPGGRIMHAEIRVGDSRVMLADQFVEYGALAPQPGQPSPVIIHLYVTDVDAVFERAVQAGAEVTMPVTDMFWGDRYGKLKDPFGHSWSIATHKEDLTPEEIGARAAKAGMSH